MSMDWVGDLREASARVHLRECQVLVREGRIHMYLDGREVFDPSVEDIASAKRALERAAFRRAGGRLPTALAHW